MPLTTTRVDEAARLPLLPSDAAEYARDLDRALHWLIRDLAQRLWALETTTGIAPRKPGGLSRTVVIAAAYAATLTVNLSEYSAYGTVIIDTTLTGNVTWNITNGTDGQEIIWRVRQDATGSRLLTNGANIRLGTSIAATTLTTTASKLDYIVYRWNGTNGKADVIDFIKGF